MRIERMQVTNHERWGNLVKTWATGKTISKMTIPIRCPTRWMSSRNNSPRPKCSLTVPDRFKHIKFVAQEQDTITVKLPPKVTIEDSEALLNQPGSTYPLPPFYKRLFNGIDPVIPEDDKFKVHAERIGDYTLSLCA